MSDWRIIKGFSSYKVSSDGRVKSFCHKAPKILKPGTDTKGYKYVNLSLNNKAYPKRIHLLVLEAFVRPRVNVKEQGRHLDGNKLNNHLLNLAYGTSKVNSADKNGQGRNNLGSKNGGGGKLSIEDVVGILYDLHYNKKGPTDIGRDYKVSHAMICRIKARKTWNINKWERDLTSIKDNLEAGVHSDIDSFNRMYKEFKKLLKFKFYSNIKHLKIRKKEFSHFRRHYAKRR
jgi:hypothetical protein